jgi:hypothetical protein
MKTNKKCLNIHENKFFYFKQIIVFDLNPPSAPAGTGRYSVGQSIYKKIYVYKQLSLYMYSVSVVCTAISGLLFSICG